MQNLSNFLSKFKKFKDPKEERLLISKVISSAVGFTIGEDLISLQNGVVKIKAGGKMKSEVYIKKDLILLLLKNNFSNLHITDIV